MTKRCSIQGCHSHKLNQYVSHHHLVRKGEVREDWRLAIESLNGQVVDVNQPLTKFFICDLHFDPKFIRTLGTCKRTTEDAVPTVFPNMQEQMNEPPTDEVEDHPTDDFAEEPIEILEDEPTNDFDERYLLLIS